VTTASAKPAPTSEQFDESVPADHLTLETTMSNKIRVRHEDYGDGTVLQRDGDYLIVLFDGEAFGHVGIHVEDVDFLPASDTTA
jgi:hypothetical protein